MRKPSCLELTAYHGAGHAVADYLQQRRFAEISIIPDKLWLGCRVQTCAGALICETCICLTWVF